MNTYDHCPLCQTPLPGLLTLTLPTSPDVKCPGCRRVWYYLGHHEAPIASRPMKVRMTKIPEVGDKITDVLKPIDPPS